jgi:pyruvate/2-oxoglutarate dehydrogenase complex dihydrolipoamide acyltransferase (E2) component
MPRRYRERGRADGSRKKMCSVLLMTAQPPHKNRLARLQLLALQHSPRSRLRNVRRDHGEAPAPSAAAQPKKPAADRPAGSRVTPVALRLAQRHSIDAEALQGTGPGGRVTKEDVQRAIDDGTATPQKPASEAPAPSPAAQPKKPAAERPAGSRVTPVALRLAQRHSIDAEALQGTGPGGRVTKEDVQRAIDDGTATPQKAPSEAPAPSPAAQPKKPAAERPAGSRVTPVALRLAQRHSIDAEEALQGTGPGGVTGNGAGRTGHERRCAACH